MCLGKHIVVVFLLALISGCASNPIPRDLRAQAQPLNYTQVTVNPKTTAGATVIWGGRIIDTVNNTNGAEIYVLQLPVNRHGRPGNNDNAAEGRFILVSGKSLDPATYPKGRLLTVAGRLDGVQIERLNNVLFRYPVLNIVQLHLWGNRQRDVNDFYIGANSNPERNWGYYPVWWDGDVGWYYPEGYRGSHAGESRSGGEHH